MSIGQALLYLALAAGATATAAAAANILRPSTTFGRIRQAAWLTAGLTAATSFLFLLWQFITVDVRYEYVFLYTSDAMPFIYRIAGTWTGREGSLLLWTTYTVIAAWLLGRNDKPSKSWAHVFLGLLTTALLAAVAFQGLYRGTPEFFLQGRPGGNGLNPLLKSPFIVIHPPLMFLAYALTTVLAAIGLGALASRENPWSTLGRTWSRSNWLLFTTAMGLGGIWAYYTLGFGGYWAWDPVEVANLLPWLALTAFMHMQSANARHGDFALAGPWFAVLPFFFTLFSAISTRSGLWFSVHAFTDPPNTFNPDAAARFQSILQAEPLVAFFTAMALGTLLLGCALWTRQASFRTGALRRTTQWTAPALALLAAWAFTDIGGFLSGAFEAAHRVSDGNLAFGLIGILVVVGGTTAAPALLQQEPEAPARRGRLAWLNERTLIQLSALLLAAGTLMLFLFHMQAVNGWNRAFYDARFPWLITPIIVVLAWFFLSPILGRKRTLVASGAGLAIAGLVAASLGSTAYLIVLASLLAAAAFVDLTHTAGPKTKREWVHASALLLAAILNVAFWVSPPTIRLGFTWQPMWPTQLWMGAIAVYALVQAHRILNGRRVRAPWHVYAITGVLGGFYVAPILALLAWQTRTEPSTTKANVAAVRNRRSAIHGIHFVVALGLLAFTLSTYLETEETVTLRPGETAQIGGRSILYSETELTREASTPWAADVTPRFHVDDSVKASGYLYWEPQKDHYDPLPIAARTWSGDVFFDVHGVCIDPSGECTSGNDWIMQHGDTGRRIQADQEITAVEARILTLPAVGLVWAAWLLGITYSGMLIAGRRT